MIVTRNPPYTPNRLKIRDLTVSYDRIPAVHHVSLDLVCGQCIGLLGPNGAGKTSLIKAIAGLVARETGTITLQGQGNVEQKQRGKIAYLPQRGTIDWDFPITVRAMVEMGRFAQLGGWGLFSKSDADIVDEALHLTNLEKLANRQISALSGGQQQRAFLARAYAQQAEYYLLDEPFNGLDNQSQKDLRDLLRQMARDGKLVLVSHHDLNSVKELFDQVIMLNGELVAFGPVDETFTQTNLDKTYSMNIMTGRAV